MGVTYKLVVILSLNGKQDISPSSFSLIIVGIFFETKK